ncbi:hypothetical protein FisN_7Hh301 [Fistulifera solaris]|uniref:tRNA pseudouridine synthase n=1 Tax=Fistulifera solaris TaxID=1519565 RepID=A0A1Z5KSM9_FISSO|nr:hypothetical protein FisN_7Hh301 [Fistulifera solaris]|eukprot:GAX29102.1 hypothetical protein FisN_7Hh301 [Fistulifera solaris]
MIRPAKRPHFTKEGTKKSVTVTIQECLEEAVITYSNHVNPQKLITVNDLKLKFAGRTDKGVHARGQVVTVCLPPWTEGLDEIQRGINSRLPMDISVDRIELLETELDPRHDVKQKTYSYTVKYRRQVWREDGTIHPRCHLGIFSFRQALDPPNLWWCPWALNDTLLPELCQQLSGTHNYRAFVHKQVRDEQSHVMTLDQMSVTFQQVTPDEDEAPVIVARFKVQAKGFRRTMVRNLVGYCIDVCRGHESVTAFKWDAIWSGSDEVADRINAAPACGLCLESVVY